MSVQLPHLLSDGMVLQRDAQVNLWGKADEPVTIDFLSRQYHALPDADGQWKVTLSGLAPGGPFTLCINEHTLRNVYIGDVWLCSGQSNMELPMKRVRHMYPETWRQPSPLIRQFTVPERTNFHAPQAELEGGEWLAASPEALSDFSAVGYFFAQRLFEQYGVPIGLLLCAIGGTPIHAWMSRGALKDFPELLQEADRCADDAYVAKAQAEDARRNADFFSRIDLGDPGMTGRWFSKELDDSGWEQRPLLAPWEGTGSCWLRKTIHIPPGMAGLPATLFLGTLTDWDTVYVNGEPVGTTTYRYAPREYEIPALPEGSCVLTVRAISKNGGGFMPGKQYMLSTTAGCLNLNGIWRFRHGGRGSEFSLETYFHYQPTGLFHGMLSPLQRYAIRGTIWYQGEADSAKPERYAEKCAAMVRDWRKGWGFDFPFLFVELAHWDGGPEWPLLREQQWQALEKIPCSAMAAADDLGEYNDLHPQNKQAIGDRLARLARRVAYGETLPPSPFEIFVYREHP